MALPGTYWEIWYPGGYTAGEMELHSTLSLEDRTVVDASQIEGAEVWKIEWQDVSVPGVGLVTRRVATRTYPSP